LLLKNFEESVPEHTASASGNYSQHSAQLQNAQCRA